MSGRSVLITGCSSGIGLASAREMKSRGWRVFATARKPEDIARLKEEGFDSLYLDYAEPQSIEAAAGEVLQAAGSTLTGLFNNGSYGQPGAFEDMTTDALRAQFEANFFGWHDLTARVIPAMRAQGRGRIVFCSSVFGFIAAPYRGAYCASKFAVEALADTLRLELAGSGIKVSLIEPGPIATRTTPWRPIAATSMPTPRRTARFIATASPGSRHTPVGSSSSDLKRSRPKSPTRWRAATRSAATTLRCQLTPPPCFAASCRPGRSTPSPPGTEPKLPCCGRSSLI
jgi:NAD(P)-dependent dehydrogenase (short-subunit alcohol dehydrogenase family)